MFTKVEIWTVGRTEKGLAVLLRIPGSKRCIPVPVEQDDAKPIFAALSGSLPSPPRSSQILKSFSHAVGAPAESIELMSMEASQELRAIIHFSGGNERFSLDAHPADAMVLALLSELPLFLDDAAVESRQVEVDLPEEEIPLQARLTRLRRERDQYAEAEEYEEAARIRDRIIELEKNMSVSEHPGKN
ncbi:MAG: bifunctional nuclease family protein [Spirochaetales bacterium]|nr:bifunctional nuclease family protein [Spirochaetales bacterium]